MASFNGDSSAVDLWVAPLLGFTINAEMGGYTIDSHALPHILEEHSFPFLPCELGAVLI
jgi:hypothetical protein